MGVYGEHVLPRLIDKVCGLKAIQPLRARACAGLHGRVVELGFGSGLNLAHYPAAVTGVAAVEPSHTAWKLALERVSAAPFPVERVGLDGQRLPLDDDSCDAALSTFTLCTIPDAMAALGEVRRVLKPGATLHFLEHGLAPDEKVRRTQQRLEPIQKRIAGGCHLTREIDDLVRAAGFEIAELDEFYEDGSPRFLGADYLGVAVSPD